MPRSFTRLAIEIANTLDSAVTHPAPVTLPSARWQQCERSLRLIRKASHKGWRLAVHRMRCELQQNLQLIQAELTLADQALQSSQLSSRCASFPDILADLAALHEEFDGVAFDGRKQTLSVTTEPIVLEGIELGPFEIQLDWGDLGKEFLPDYRLIAVDPHPSSSNETVTHPHVQDEGLCEGAGRSAIRSSLEQGRLFDFFLIVANLLRTYNPGSPYVSLSVWHGIACGDCGDYVVEDEGRTCDHCSTTVCGECDIQCAGCRDTYCNSCVTRCSGCEELHCHSCLNPCSGCRTELCPNCLDEERCDECHAAESENEPDDEREETSTAEAGAPLTDEEAETPLHAHRLGEAAVPA